MLFIEGRATPFRGLPTEEPWVDSDDLTEADNYDTVNGFSFMYGMDIPFEDVE